MSGFFSADVVSQEKPVGLVPKCGACGFYKSNVSPKMPVYGDGAKRVLIVGEYPTAEDDEEGKPFRGSDGETLRKALRAIGVNFRADCWSTNALICHPTEKPDSKIAGYCRPNILNTIDELKPRVVITLGRLPLVSALKDYWKDVSDLDRWVGWQIPLEKYWLCPTHHPGFLRHKKNELMNKEFVSAIHRAFEIDTDPEPQPEYGSLVEILYEEDEIYEALKEMNQSEWVAFDYETNCLKPEYPKAKIYSCAVSDGKRTITYPWKGRAIEVTGKFLRSKKTRKIASNLKMEEKWTRMEFGHGVTNWGWDTMIAAHCLDNRPAICSIKFQALVKLGCPSYNDHISPFLRGRGWYNRINHLPVKDLLHYGGMDAILEYRVAMIQRKEMGFE